MLLLKSVILNGGTLISNIQDHFDKFSINDDSLFCLRSEKNAFDNVILTGLKQYSKIKNLVSLIVGVLQNIANFKIARCKETLFLLVCLSLG